MILKPTSPEIDGYGMISNGCFNHLIRMALHELGHDVFYLPENDDPEGFGSLEEKAAALPGYMDMDNHDLLLALTDKYIDWRCFGGVGGFINSKNKPEKVKGGSLSAPGAIITQYGMSIEPIEMVDVSITSCIDGQKGSSSNRMGSKSVVKHGLYKINGSIIVPNAEKSGFTTADLEAFKKAIPMMFEASVSCAKPSGSVVLKKAVYWNHQSRYGEHRSDECFDKTEVTVKPGIESPSSYADYDINVGEFADLKPEVHDF